MNELVIRYENEKSLREENQKTYDGKIKESDLEYSNKITVLNLKITKFKVFYLLFD